MFTVFLMNFITLATSRLLINYCFRVKGMVDYIISLFIVFLSQVVLSQLILGIFGILTLKNVIMLHFVFLLTAYAIIKGAKLMPAFLWKDKLAALRSGINLNKIEIFCLSLIIGFALVKIAINLVNPPFGWDNLNYHFTFPVEWLKHGNLGMPISVSGDPSVSYYPINGSLLFLWWILPLKNVFLADLGQVPFFIIAFLAVYSIGRKLLLSREYALFSAAIFTLIPNYFKQFEIAYVDVIVAALFLATLNYLFLLRKEFSLRNTVLFSLSLGIALGTKTTVMPFVVLFILPFLYISFTRKEIKKALFFILVSILIMLAMGAFIYIRNFIQTGDPLYPLHLRLFNRVIFKGVADMQMYKTAIRPGDYNLGKILFSEGLGAQTVIFFLPAVLLGLPVMLFKRRKIQDYLLYFLILPCLFVLIFRFIVPLPNLRYIYALFAISSIISFYLINILRIPSLLVRILVVVCALSSIAEIASRFELVSSIFISVAIFFLFPVFLRVLKSPRIKAYALISVFILFVTLVILQKDYNRNEYPRYFKMVKYSGFWPEATKAWDWLNQNTSGDNIAYVGRSVPFPLYGDNFKNNVYYVSVNSVEPAALHYFPDSKYEWGYQGDLVYRNFEDDKNYRGRANYDIWLENLRRRNIKYLFVYSEVNMENNPFPMEDRWASMHPDRFILAFSNDIIHIYKVNL